MGGRAYLNDCYNRTKVLSFSNARLRTRSGYASRSSYGLGVYYIARLLLYSGLLQPSLLQ